VLPAGAVLSGRAEPRLLGRTATITLAAGRRKSAGVLQGIDYRRLAELARHHDCMLRLLLRVGEHVPAQGAVIEVYGGGPAAGRVLAGLDLGRTRTLWQDPAFGLRQLVDIAIQALSPAVNQPTTAVQVIDRIEDLLLRIAARPGLTGYFADSDGQVRLLQPVISWEELVELAFTEITDYGASSAQVVRRLLAAYDVLERAAGPARGAVLHDRRTRLLGKSEANRIEPATLRPDPLGLG